MDLPDVLSELAELTELTELTELAGIKKPRRLFIAVVNYFPRNFLAVRQTLCRLFGSGSAHEEEDLRYRNA